MESGTILHLALLRKISNLSSNPNYRQKFYQFKKGKALVQNESSVPSFCCLKKQGQLPLIQISNRQHNFSAPGHKNKARRHFFDQQNTTISGWSINGPDQAELQRQTRYDHDYQQKAHRVAGANKVRRKNHSLVSQPKKQNTVCHNQENQYHNFKIVNKKRAFHESGARNRYSLVKHININYHEQNDIQTKQTKVEPILQTGQKLTSFQAFVAQAKLKDKSKKK